MADPAAEPAEPALMDLGGAPAEEAPAAPAPAPEPVVVTPPPPEAKGPEVVPLAAMLQERGKFRSDLEAKDAALAEMRKEIEALKTQVKAPPPEPEAPPPDYLEDPKGYVDAQLVAARKELKALQDQMAEGRKILETNQQQAAQRDQQQAFIANLQRTESEFAAKTPDYMDALAHVRNIRAAQLKLFAPQATEQQIAQQIGNEELAAAVGAAQSGRNAAELAYEYAKTIGYTPKQAAAAAAAVAAPAAPVRDTALAAAGSLGASGNSGPVTEDENDGLGGLDSALAARFGRRA